MRRLLLPPDPAYYEDDQPMLLCGLEQLSLLAVARLGSRSDATDAMRDGLNGLDHPAAARERLL
ncbi:MAG TPA: hypothetical protein VK824_01680 [Planctomycetota bacterium]|nr:hypothetical protein [Planctomycetota bacterium]